MTLLGWVLVILALLGHHRYQERPTSDTYQRENEAEYDDRDSMSPFAPEEQRPRGEDHKPEADQKDDETLHQRQLVKWTKVLAIVTGTLAFATFVVAGISGWQVHEGRLAADQQHADTIDALGKNDDIIEAMQSQSSQLERLATENRAYIFANYPPQAPQVGPILDMGNDRHSFSISLNYVVYNAGQTPAIITNIESHLFVKEISTSDRDAPLPDTARWNEYMENTNIRTSGIPGVQFNNTINNPIRFILPANHIVPIEEKFGYLVRTIKFPQVTEKWFYARIEFEDIYRIQHWSCYYVHLTGTESAPVNGFCNNWD